MHLEIGSIVTEYSSFAVDFYSLSLILFPLHLGHCPKAEIISASQEVQSGSGIIDPVRLPAQHSSCIPGEQKICAQVRSRLPFGWGWGWG